MRKNLLFCLFILVFSCAEKKEEVKEIEKEVYKEITMDPQPDSVLRHVVLFAFKESSSPADINQIIEAFENLQNEIPEIKSFEWGLNNSPENLNKGLTHAFFLTFHSEADRETYLPHPAHQKFGELIGPHLKDVTVVDYWTK